MEVRIIALAADHAGWPLKASLKSILDDARTPTIDLGTSDSQSVDYPDYADRLAAALAEGRAQVGVLICGTGIGMSIAANRYRHVRAALCHEPESARLARAHNNANVLVLGGRMVGEGMARAILETFLAAPFEGGRHLRRVALLSSLVPA